MNNFRIQIKRFLIVMVIITIGFVYGTDIKVHSVTEENSNGDSNSSEALDVLNDQINVKRNEITKLKYMKDIYEKKIKNLQSEEVSLKNQLLILDNQIQVKGKDIEITESQISRTNLEIKKLNKEIQEMQKIIDNEKVNLENLIKQIYEEQQTNYLSILILENSFSSFYDRITFLENIHKSLKYKVEEVGAQKDKFEIVKTKEEEKKVELSDYKDELEEQKVKLEDQEEAKKILLVKTSENEDKFSDLLSQIKAEQSSANAEIQRMEKQIRELLETKKDGVHELGAAKLSWPVDTKKSKGISAYFHDPDYPYRFIFEHPAIDLRVGQGTAVLASDTGYVAKAKNAGMGYSYIMLVHGEGISTVYGHISRLDVEEDTYVVKGQQIGLSGGLPGTPGAGRLTTGPHLHYEVRLNGIPVDPLNYLP